MLSHLRVGELITSLTEVEYLPVGTVIRDQSASHDSANWTRLPNGNWAANGRTWSDDAIPANRRLVHSLPEGVQPSPLSEAQYRWRFRQHMLRARNSQGVSYEGTVGALEQLGCGHEDFPLVPGLRVTCPEDMMRLPTDSLVHVGHPDDWSGYALFAMTNGHRARLFGGGPTRNDPVTVLRVGDHTVDPATGTTWADEPAAEDADTAIALFKAKAWVVGSRLKSAQKWCPTYEAIMAQFGITAACMQDALPGAALLGVAIGPEQCAGLPEGTVLRWVSKDGLAQSWYMRVADSTNRAGTRRIFGWAGSGAGRPGHFADHLWVMWMPSEPVLGMEVPMTITDVPWAAAWEHLPPGTRFTYNTSTTYVICADGLATEVSPLNREREVGVPARGRHLLSAFTPNVSNLALCHLPMPGRTTAATPTESERTDDLSF